MVTKTIEMTYEQVDAIVLGELQSALETNIKDYFNNVNVCDTRKEHRRLIKSLHRTVSYFMSHNDFNDYMSEIDWPEDITRSKFAW
jgi:hypothetical protein